jgi:hypothetical protein
MNTIKQVERDIINAYAMQVVNLENGDGKVKDLGITVKLIQWHFDISYDRAYWAVARAARRKRAAA